MKIALVHPYPVHAAAMGGTTRVYALARHLAARGHQVNVFAHASMGRDADERAIRELGTLGIEQRVFPLQKPALVFRASWMLGPTPYFVRRNRNAALEAAVLELSPEVVHVEHGYLAALLERLPARVVRILAEQETMSLAIDRLSAAKERSPYEWFLLSQRRKVEAFERRALRTFHRVWAISQREARHLGQLVGGDVPVLPHVVDTQAFLPGSREAIQPSQVLFVGNYAHRPNWHALLWFLEQVWPRIRQQVPSATFVAVGPGLDETGRARVMAAGVTAPGRVEDLASAYRQAAVFINPIRSGGGMRGKVLEAFSCGCAVVSTEMGMEGIDAKNGEHCLLADAPEDFSAAVVRALKDAPLRQMLGGAARALVERLYDPRQVFGRLESDFQTLVDAQRSRAA